MMIFWHIIASFFLVLGLLDFIFEIKKALFRENTDGLWLLVSLDSENEARSGASFTKGFGSLGKCSRNGLSQGRLGGDGGNLPQNMRRRRF